MKHVIFDLDGVIIDSVSSMEDAFNFASSQAGLRDGPSFGEFIGLSGLPLSEIVRSLNLPASFADDFHNRSRSLVDSIDIFPGIWKVLEDLQARGIGMSLFTGKDRVRTLEIVTRRRLDGFFKSIITCSDITRGKPDPEGIHRIASLVGLSSAEMVYVGDAPSDILCARNAGIPSIGALWGVSEVHTLLECGPSFLVSNATELGQLLDQLSEYNCLLVA